MELHLIEQHINDMRDVIIACDDYKAQTLKKRSYDTWIDWVRKAADQINENHFEINDTRKNTFVWLLDQIQHCPPVAATPLAQRVIEWLPMAAQGPYYYFRFCQKQQYDSLFG